MEIINVRSDNQTSINKMKKHLNDPDAVIVVAILADWCGACRMFKPVWHSTVNNYIKSSAQKNKKLILATVQNTAIQELNMENVQGFPTIRIIKNKHIINEKLGGMEQDTLIRHIDEAKKMCVNISPKSHAITSIKRRKTKKAKKAKKAKKVNKTNKGKTRKSKGKTRKSKGRSKSKKGVRKVKRKRRN
jgi:thiol-disulfide isomerase/thioredoxin